MVGEREQGTLEPALTTPVRREELLIGKAAADLIPSLAISSKASDIRVAQQLSVLASLPPVALTLLLSFHVISSTFLLAASLAAVLLLIDCAAYLLVSRLFDRERLVTGTSHAAA